MAEAEICRAARFALVPLGVMLATAPFLFKASALHIVVSILAGLGVAALALPRGQITKSCGTLDRIIR